jgi:hypothetical protein
MSAVATVPTLLSFSAEEDTAAQQGRTKYRYPEFAGWAGERYLKKVLRQILPMALYRTWEIFVEHQASGSECYLGMSQLAAIAGRTSRTMQKNLAELEAKQLMVERAEYKILAGSDGTKKSRAVVVKDFSNLYALAHEYHEWLNAPEYIAPVRAMVALIVRNEHLVTKLRRFNNYRRILYTQLPGPPSTGREEDRWFTEYQTEAPVSKDLTHTTDQPPTDVQANKEMAKKPAIELAKDSPKRIREIPEHHHRRGDSCDSVLPFSEGSGRGTEERSVKPSIQSVMEAGGKRVRETGVHLSSVSFPPSHREGDEQAQQDLAGEQEFSSSDHPLARTFVQAIAVPFGDLNPKGSLTRILSILTSAQLSHPTEEVLCLVRAYMIARNTRTLRTKHYDVRTGQANRMPLFCSMFERFVQARRAEQRWEYTWVQMTKDIAADNLLLLWWNEQQKQDHELMKVLEERQGETQHPSHFTALEPTPKEVKHQVSEVLSRQLYQQRLSQGKEEREKRATYARSIIARVSSMAGAMNEPLIGEEHLLCGCPLSHKLAGKRVCAHCVPNPIWPEEILELLHSIVEVRTDGETSEGTKREQENLSGAANNPEDLSSHARWTEREEAYRWGKWVLVSLISSGYTAEMVVRPQEEAYQVVLVDNGCELILETEAQAQFLIEQAHANMVQRALENPEGLVPRNSEGGCASLRSRYQEERKGK